MDLKIVGAGSLGVRVALLWKSKYPDAKIYLKTRSNKPGRSTLWREAGFIPVSAEDDTSTANYVVFSAPPTSNPSYDKDVARAASKEWTGKGQFVFTASGGVYSENKGGTVDETSEVKATTERSTVLLAAEKATIEAGGTAIRFGGLYTKNQGPHNFWLKSGRGEFSSMPNGFINLIHYDDAARVVVAALLSPKSVRREGKLYLVSDGTPITRKDICLATIQCPDYKDCKVPRFTGGEDQVDGKKYNSSKIYKDLIWAPKFQSYEKFMAEKYNEEVKSDLLYGVA